MRQPNASLIREIRMITQQFLRSKENEAFWNGRSPTRFPAPVPASEPWVPLCYRCLTRKRDGYTKAEPRKAVTMGGGTALCIEHV